MTNVQFLDQLIEDTHKLITFVKEHFNDLTPEQVNAQPLKSEWTVGQCFEHLLLSGNPYLERLDKALDVAPKANRKFKQTFIGKLMLPYIGPNPPFRTPVPSAMQPKEKLHTIEVIHQFTEQQHSLLNLLEKAKGKDIVKVTITSPFSRLLRLNIGDCFLILNKHGWRHVLQAKTILDAIRN